MFMLFTCRPEEFFLPSARSIWDLGLVRGCARRPCTWRKDFCRRACDAAPPGSPATCWPGVAVGLAVDAVDDAVVGFLLIEKSERANQWIVEAWKTNRWTDHFTWHATFSTYVMNGQKRTVNESSERRSSGKSPFRRNYKDKSFFLREESLSTFSSSLLGHLLILLAISVFSSSKFFSLLLVSPFFVLP